MNGKNARAQAYKDFEDILKGDSTASATDILKEFEKELSLRQMRVYNAAYDAAIAEGKDASQAAKAGNQALRQAKLPPLAGDRATRRMKPKDSTILEQKLAQQWYDGLDAGTKADIDTLMQATGKDLHQTFIDHSSKPTRKSLFDEPVESPKSAPKSNPNEMGMMIDESGGAANKTTDIVSENMPFGSNTELNQDYMMHKLSKGDAPFTGTYKIGDIDVTKTIGKDYVDILGYFPDDTYFEISKLKHAPSTSYRLTKTINGKEVIIDTTVNNNTNKITQYQVKDATTDNILYDELRNNTKNKEYKFDVVSEINNALNPSRKHRLK